MVDFSPWVCLLWYRRWRGASFLYSLGWLSCFHPERPTVCTWAVWSRRGLAQEEPFPEIGKEVLVPVSWEIARGTQWLEFKHCCLWQLKEIMAMTGKTRNFWLLKKEQFYCWQGLLVQPCTGLSLPKPTGISYSWCNQVDRTLCSVLQFQYSPFVSCNKEHTLWASTYTTCSFFEKCSAWNLLKATVWESYHLLSCWFQSCVAIQKPRVCVKVQGWMLWVG